MGSVWLKFMNILRIWYDSDFSSMFLHLIWDHLKTCLWNFASYHYGLTCRSTNCVIFYSYCYINHFLEKAIFISLINEGFLIVGALHIYTLIGVFKSEAHYWIAFFISSNNEHCFLLMLVRHDFFHHRSHWAISPNVPRPDER